MTTTNLSLLTFSLLSLLLTSTASALTNVVTVTPGSHEAIAVNVTQIENEMLAFTVVLTDPKPRLVVAKLIVRDAERIYSGSSTPILTGNSENRFNFSIPRDLAKTSKFSLRVVAARSFHGDGKLTPGTGGTIYRFQLSEFVAAKTFQKNEDSDVRGSAALQKAPSYLDEWKRPSPPPIVVSRTED